MTCAAEAVRAPIRFRSCARSHAGMRRPDNQDRVLDNPRAGLWAVADGMGGHADGARAAQSVVDALAGIAPSASGYARLAEVERRVAEVDRSLAGEGTGSGSTLVALLAHDAHLACLWAGDSRAYLLRDGAARPLTRDHSVVQELVDAGAIGEEERRGHPRANVVTRAVGGGEGLELERRFLAAEPGDRLLLCSDGLTLCLDPTEIGPDLPLEAAADALLGLALERGAPDNVSLVLIEAS